MVCFWESSTGKEMVSVDIGPGLDVPARLSPDARFLAAPDLHGAIRLWDVASGKQLQRFRHGPDGPARPRDLIGPWEAFGFSGDSRLLATASREGTFVCIWEVPGGKEWRALDIRDKQAEVRSLWLSLDGKALATV